MLTRQLSLLTLSVVMLVGFGCSQRTESINQKTLPSAALEARETVQPPPDEALVVGAEVLRDDGFELLAGKRVGLIANRSSQVEGQSVVDLLHQAPEVELGAIFVPEHGLRAEAGAGEEISDGVDLVTGVVVHSLYQGDNTLRPETLEGLDVLVFDLQDVGARYYTYTATMGLAMQEAARQGLSFVVLDRPNPLGGLGPDGPMRDPESESFVSLYPVPALHGLTAGELARAIVGEEWLEGLEDLDLSVVPMRGWERSKRWPETGLDWVPPSPGLPDVDTSLLYPATVWFEATTVSIGRGTDVPFRQLGAPWLDANALASRLTGDKLPGLSVRVVTFTPEPTTANPEPLFEGQAITGIRLEVTDAQALRPAEVGIHLLRHLHDLTPAGELIDRPAYFDLLAGGPNLRLALSSGAEPSEVISSWRPALERFEFETRPYYLY